MEGQRLRKASIMEGNAFFREKMSKKVWSLVAILTCTSFYTFRSACFTQGSWSWTALSGKANDWRNRQQDKGRWKRREKERKRERDKKEKRERERERERENGRKREERERPSVCAFNTSPCVRSKRPCVYRQHAHMFWEPSSDSKSYGETCNNTVDYRISGVPLSAIEQQDTTRENKVKKLIVALWMTKNVQLGETDAEKGPSAKARTPPTDTFTMVRQWIVQKLVVCHRVEKNTWCCTTESPCRGTSTSPQELQEFKIRCIGFSR